MNKIRTNHKPRSWSSRIGKAGLVGLVLAVAFSLTGGVALAESTAATAPSLGTASSFAVLSAANDAGGAVTLTHSRVIGDVGSSGPMASVVLTEGSKIDGAIIAPVSTQVVDDFDTAYAKFMDIQCDVTLTGTLAGETLAPGVYCFEAAAALTGVLTLQGPADGIWIFKIGTKEAGALTGTNFSVVMDGGTPCNVYWWVDAAATMTTSNFVGTILAGAAITVTDGTFDGDALAKAAVTLKGTILTGCEAGGGKHGSRCNQGVGNGPEGCDPGNSNNHNPSNDENGGVPGNPGRK